MPVVTYQLCAESRSDVPVHTGESRTIAGMTTPATAPDVPEITPSAVTVSITRRMTTNNHVQIMAWFQAGASLAETFDGFLGTGWVRPSEDSNVWHALYRFRDQASLDAWQHSSERAWWLASGGDMVEHEHREKRVGIEGWFDEPRAASALSMFDEQFDPVQDGDEPFVPPRWKQMVSIFTGFFPMSLLVQYLLSHILPTSTPLIVRVLTSIAIVMPPMVYFVLPFVTKLYQPWFEKSRPKPTSGPAAAPRSTGRTP